MLDLDSLRLTPKDMMDNGRVNTASRDIRDAQFAKLADGIRIWLYSEIDGGHGIARVQMELEGAMKKAGVEWSS